jgi:PAS domain S-box-containing protein
MLDKDFLNKLTVLYVEDEELIRENMSNVFEKLFKKTIIAFDGKEGVEKFKSSIEDKVEIDIIISDINMPELNGIEMLKQIRDIDKEIPIVLTTAHVDTNYFLEAIKLKVFHYAIKPVNMKELVVTIQDATLKHYQNKIISSQQLQNSRYLDIINQVAIVSKTDLHGNITFVNDIFCEVSEYSKEELIGSNQRITRHSDMPTILFDGLWDNLRAGKIWKGKIKNQTKSGGFYFVNANVFPIFDKTGDSIVEYMAVRFLITDEEKEKRDFKKQMIQNIKDSKVSQIELKNKIKELEFQVSLNGETKIIFETLEVEKRKSSKLSVQIQHLEVLIEKKVQEEEKNRIKNLDKIQALMDENKDLYSKNAKNLSKIKELEKIVEYQEEKINFLNNK